MKLTLRDLFWLTALVAMGCAWWMHYSSYSRTLYDDAEVSYLELNHTVDASENESVNYLVVPEGKTMARSVVFKTLGIEEHRLKDFRAYGANHDLTLSWQISPTFDLVCVSATNDPRNDGLLPSDPNRQVGGVRFRDRSRE